MLVHRSPLSSAGYVEPVLWMIAGTVSALGGRGLADCRVKLLPPNLPHLFADILTGRWHTTGVAEEREAWPVRSHYPPNGPLTRAPKRTGHGVGRPFFAAFRPEATWFTALKPAPDNTAFPGQPRADPRHVR
jgi:hypothetical protein